MHGNWFALRFHSLIWNLFNFAFRTIRAIAEPYYNVDVVAQHRTVKKGNFRLLHDVPPAFSRRSLEVILASFCRDLT